MPQVGAEATYIVDAANDINNYVYIPFPVAIPLSAGKRYMIEVRKYFAADERIYLASNVSNPDNSTVCYGPFGENDAVNWYNGFSFTPAIRMSFDATVGIEEDIITGAKLGQNMPNPTTGLTNIEYTLTNPADVQFELVDVTGKVIKKITEGAKGSGQHLIELDVTHLSHGVYYYSLVIDGNKLTRKMMIAD